MRVAVVGLQYPDSFVDNLVDSLSRMGHEPVAVGRPLRVRAGRVAAVVRTAQGTPWAQLRLQRAIVAEVAAAQPELIISVDATLLPEVVDELKRLASRTVFWFPDAVTNLGRQLMFVSAYDALFFKDPVLVERSQRLVDAPAWYLPEACNPSWHVPQAEPTVDPAIVVVGNMYPFRARLLDRMLKAGLPLRIYGPRSSTWMRADAVLRCHTGRYIVRREKASVFRGAGAVLNSLHPGESNGVNCRLFEAAGSGGAVLTEFREELPDFFDPQSEVLSFSTFDDLVDKARWLLDRPEQARAIGDRAAARCHAEHTYDHRLTVLLEQAFASS